MKPIWLLLENYNLRKRAVKTENWRLFPQFLSKPKGQILSKVSGYIEICFFLFTGEKKRRKVVKFRFDVKSQKENKNFGQKTKQSLSKYNVKCQQKWNCEIKPPAL